jgi:hypothetical protein
LKEKKTYQIGQILKSALKFVSSGGSLPKQSKEQKSPAEDDELPVARNRQLLERPLQHF